MTLLGECEAQYVNNLLSSRKIVLRTDRDAGNNPTVKILTDDTEENLIIQFSSDISVQPMLSNPKEGAKDRTDIHFNKKQIDAVINILQPYVTSLRILFDDTPRTSPDPTGLEHPNGLPLGVTHKITYIEGIVKANYGSHGFMTYSSGKIYLDAERYARGEKIHFGISMSNHITGNIYEYNSLELIIPNNQLKRFLHSLKVAKKWLD